MPPRAANRGKPAAGVGAAPALGGIRGALPEALEPQLCRLAEAPPDGAGWLSEIKFDGYRLIASVAHGKVRLLTRNGHDWAERMPALAKAVARLPVQAAMLDGELVALRDDGATSFPRLQAALRAGRDDALFFYAFDLLHLDGWDYRGCVLLERKRVLAGLIADADMLRYSDHHVGDSHEIWRNACRMHLEGIVCKLADAPYVPGRGRGWVKVKCGGREEFVVLGWTPPGGSRVGLGALHVGYYDPEGRLHYAGGVGSGFDEQELRSIRKRLDGIAAPPPDNLLMSGDPLDRSIAWVRPQIVVEVRFTDWSGAGRVRHPVYLGIREDKPASTVVRDVADPAAERQVFGGSSVATRKGRHGAIPPAVGRITSSVNPPPQPPPPVGAPTKPVAATVGRAARIVVARPPRRRH
jgi:bifunctional non-homologous end joining protein LigD